MNDKTSMVFDMNVGSTICNACGFSHQMNIFHLDIEIWDGLLGVCYVPRAFVDSIRDSIEAALEETDFALEKRAE